MHTQLTCTDEAPSHLTVRRLWFEPSNVDNSLFSSVSSGYSSFPPHTDQKHSVRSMLDTKLSTGVNGQT